MYEVPEVSDGALVDHEKVYSVLAAEITSLSLLPPTCAPGLPALWVQMLTTVVVFAVCELPLLSRTETTKPVAVAGNLDLTFLGSERARDVAEWGSTCSSWGSRVSTDKQ